MIGLAKYLYWKHCVLPQAKRFREDPQSPWLVSFPRTGSHWLRMILERYTDRPSQPRAYFAHDNNDYLLTHTHDYRFALRPQKLIYLYRDPEPVVFSQIMYHRDDPFDSTNVEVWSAVYRAHLLHWTQRMWPNRVIVRFEQMQADIVAAITPALELLSLPLDEARLIEAAQRSTKDRVAEKTSDNPRIMNRSTDYAEQRQRFINQMGPLVRRIVVDRPKLAKLFAPTNTLRAAG